MYTMCAYTILMPTYLPFRGITYISEIRFGFVEFLAITLPKRFEGRADSPCPLGAFQNSLPWLKPSNPMSAKLTVFSYCKQ